METKVSIFMLFSLSTVLSQRDCKTPNNTDPCYRYNSREIPYLDSRHPSVRYSSATSDINKYCDLHALNGGIWYISDYNITQTCVQQESCGSRLPIWLNGSIPSPADGAVNRTGCVKTFDKCCADSYKLMIKNCDFYSVYCFWDLPNGCPERYCFDIDMSKVTTTTSTTTTTTTRTTTTTARATTRISSSPAGSTSNVNKHAIIGLSVAVATAVFAVVVLAGFIVVLKKKLASSVLPVANVGEKIAIF